MLIEMRLVTTDTRYPSTNFNSVILHVRNFNNCCKEKISHLKGFTLAYNVYVISLRQKMLARRRGWGKGGGGGGWRVLLSI